jgi:cyclohexanecarboxylate-CoA ligase
VYQLMMHLAEIVATRARERSKELAIVAVGEHGTAILTWHELWRQSERIAALLVELEVRQGDAVAYQLPNCAEFVAITLAILRIGAVCCPLMPIYRERELRWMLNRSQARLLFVRDRYHGRCPIDEIANVAPQLQRLEHLIAIGRSSPAIALPETARLSSCWLEQRLASLSKNERPVEPRAALATDLAQLLFTSGTSGTPKGVLHRHDALMKAANLAIAQLGLTARDRLYVPSPLAHQTGFLYGMWMALALGVPQILQERWEPRLAVAALTDWGATFVQAATPFLSDLVQTVEEGAAPPQSLRIFVATGAAVPRALAQRAARTLQTAICGAFGTTEGCLATLCSPADPSAKACNTDGRPLPTVQIRICDDAGSSLPCQSEGHLQVLSPTMFQGYLDDPEGTARAYTADGWYRTGDLAVIDAQGYLRVTGRVKDVINRGGEKIPVAEIEQLLYQHEAIREVAIVAMPDARLGERACAFVALQAGHTLDLRELCIFLNAHRVAKPYWPERLALLDELPKTASGKIQKFVLRERAGDLPLSNEGVKI